MLIDRMVTLSLDEKSGTIKDIVLKIVKTRSNKGIDIQLTTDYSIFTDGEQSQEYFETLDDDIGD